MTIQTAPDRLLVAVQTRNELDAALDQALEILKPVAMTERVGILVTRLAPGRYEARLNAELPPGTTRESWGPFSDEPR
ncbi:hypothetical protein AB4089_17240 [Arthrobacter sp. 2MCAF15]|uniref:hypothetical protein n=1 Tax=Arthrobacter sp. 2MCAF15 TaxID=3232984 RepID=UPI003F913709